MVALLRPPLPFGLRSTQRHVICVCKTTASSLCNIQCRVARGNVSLSANLALCSAGVGFHMPSLPQILSCRRHIPTRRGMCITSHRPSAVTVIIVLPLRQAIALRVQHTLSVRTAAKPGPCAALDPSRLPLPLQFLISSESPFTPHPTSPDNNHRLLSVCLVS